MKRFTTVYIIIYHDVMPFTNSECLQYGSQVLMLRPIIINLRGGSACKCVKYVCVVLKWCGEKNCILKPESHATKTTVLLRCSIFDFRMCS